MNTALPLDTLAAPLDAARRRVLHTALRVPVLANVYARRERRVAVQATFGILVTFMLTLLVPAVMFAASPTFFGVPHVASDVRYLVLRPRMSARVKRGIFGLCAGFTALRFLEWRLGVSLAGIEVPVLGAALVAAAVCGAREREVRAPGRLAIVIAAVVGFSVVAFLRPELTRVAFAHVHNVVGVVLWLALFRGKKTWTLLPIGALVFAAAALGSGGTIATTERAGLMGALGTNLRDVSDWLAPGLSPDAALAVTLLFVFLQAVHYAVWLGWIPQEDLPAQGTTTFKMSLRSLVKDFGPLGLAAICGLSAAMMVASCIDLDLARTTYLSLATFHGYLEVGALVFLAAGGSRIRDTSPAARAAQ